MAEDGDGNGQGSCSNALEWTHVAGAEQYFVYRLSLDFMDPTVYYFYRTAELDATAACPGGVGTPCDYDEQGDDPGFTGDIDAICPWESIGGDSQCDTPGLEAYYVTAVGAAGGESPRSNIVFWNCNEDPGYAKALPERGDALETLFVAAALLRIPAHLERRFRRNVNGESGRS